MDDNCSPRGEEELCDDSCSFCTERCTTEDVQQAPVFFYHTMIDHDTSDFESGSSDENEFSPAIINSRWTVEDDRKSRSDSTGSSSSSPGRMPRQVSFADDFGKPLVLVKSFGETPVQTPTFDNLLTPKNGRKSFLNELNHFQTAVYNQPGYEEKLVRKFPSPLDNYSQFVDKLKSQGVVLESVSCRYGNIRAVIRSRCFDGCKNSVFMRVSFDGWRSYHDWTADVFLAGNSELRQSLKYDLYEALVPIPPHVNNETSIEFALCARSEAGKLRFLFIVVFFYFVFNFPR